MSVLDIDARSDVYSLEVLLYRTPRDPEEFLRWGGTPPEFLSG
jgi:hypothetical protein